MTIHILCLWRSLILKAPATVAAHIRCELRFGVKPLNTSNGLNIVFFGASADDSVSSNGSIFALPLPPRQGAYARYYNERDINVYSDSYFRPVSASPPWRFRPELTHLYFCCSIGRETRTWDMRPHPGGVVRRQPPQRSGFQTCQGWSGPDRWWAFQGVRSSGAARSGHDSTVCRRSNLCGMGRPASVRWWVFRLAANVADELKRVFPFRSGVAGTRSHVDKSC